jgi:hypothetical protein
LLPWLISIPKTVQFVRSVNARHRRGAALERPRISSFRPNQNILR